MNSRAPLSSMLIYAPNWVGDAVMATPLIRCVKKAHPGCSLGVISYPHILELLHGLPYIDSYHPLPSQAVKQVAFSYCLSRTHHYDATLILPHSFRSAFLSYLVGSPIRVGYDVNRRSWLLTHPVQFPRDEQGRRRIEYMVNEYLRLGEAIQVSADGLGLELAVDRVIESEWLTELTQQGQSGPRIGIAPGASFGLSKCWYPDRFAKVAEYLYTQYEATIVLITGPAEGAIKSSFTQHYTKCYLDPFQHGHSIERLKAVIKNLDLLICNDSGPRHIAVAFQVPVVCIMGPTNPEYTRSPWEKGSCIRVPVECSPCQLPECPIDHRCMTLITPDMVIKEARKWITK